MNKNVLDYLNDKAQDVTSYIKTKTESANTYLTNNANKIKNKAIKATAAILTTATLMGGMSGCGVVSSILPGEEPTETASENTKKPWLTGNSNSGLFDGERYEEEDLPVINHRTEEEIAQTGLTAQDVLNSYDQLCLDLAKHLYALPKYSEDLPKEAYDKLAVEFECINTSYTQYSNGKIEYTPFYSLFKNYTAKKAWQELVFDGSIDFPAYNTSIEFKTYLDGVCFTKTLSNMGIEESEFEKTMQVLGVEPKVYTKTELKYLYPTNYESVRRFANQNIYKPIKITRETIASANPEQLATIYAMLNSLRSINLEQRLPDNSNAPELSE